ncbi:putative thioredoxin [Lyophyllum shimeji]|uniref:Thioredoxin n=1 Tax=Lyophyllum shimeji TaxID=47721 RepID=A0A9P3UIB4_LYOSH|nr:putative thioredoxin [Lyophyllum shimeji]
MASTIDIVLKPLLNPGGKYAGKVKVIIRLHVQPWHASSTWTHESALAVLRASPQNFWPYSLELFKNQENYFDIPTSTQTPTQVRESLAELAAKVLPARAAEEVKDMLKLKGSPNGGNAVTDDLKYNVKFSRQNSIHVSPTVLWDGLVAGEISSSWLKKEWEEFLAAKVQV